MGNFALGFLAGFALLSSIVSSDDGFKLMLEADKKVEECEQNQIRSVSCVAVVTAKAKSND